MCRVLHILETTANGMQSCVATEFPCFLLQDYAVHGSKLFAAIDHLPGGLLESLTAQHAPPSKRAKYNHSSSDGHEHAHHTPDISGRSVGQTEGHHESTAGQTVTQPDDNVDTDNIDHAASADGRPTIADITGTDGAAGVADYSNPSSQVAGAQQQAFTTSDAIQEHVPAAEALHSCQPLDDAGPHDKEQGVVQASSHNHGIHDPSGSEEHSALQLASTEKEATNGVDTVIASDPCSAGTTATPSSSTVGPEVEGVAGQVHKFVVSILEPLLRASVIDQTVHDLAAEQAVNKIMQKHHDRSSADFLVKEYRSIIKLVTSMVDHHAKKQHKQSATDDS